MKFIARLELTADAQSMTISSIPDTFDDLLIVMSGRTATGSLIGTGSFYVNGNQSNWRGSFLSGPPSPPTAGTTTSEPVINVNGGTTSSNSFGLAKVYIPKYASSDYKSFSIDTGYTSMGFDNHGINRLVCAQWNNTSAINSITFYSVDYYVPKSSVTVYGITTS